MCNEMYLYTRLQEECSTLRLKNKREKKRYELDYLTKAQFRKKEKELEQSQNPEIDAQSMQVIGYTAFKPLKENDDNQVGTLFAANSTYGILKKRPFFRRIKGYLCTIPETDVKTFDAVNGVTECYGAAQQKWVAVTKFSLFPLLPLFALLLLLLLLFLGGFKGCTKSPTPAPTTTEYPTVEETTRPKLPVDDTAENWSGYMPSDNSTADQGEIEIFGYDKLIINAENPYVPLINPAGNTVYFKFTVRNGESILGTTDLIPPGKCVYWNAKEVLPPGEYSLVLNLATYDITTQAQYNGANVTVNITVI